MYVIDYHSLSEQEIKQDLFNFIRGQSEGAQWLDFFNGSHGSTLIELCSGIGALLSYQASANRRETNLLTAKLKSSLYAMAYTFGYPINRRLSAKVELTINNPGEPYFHQRELPIGHFNGSPISLITSQTIESGVSKITCVVGQWKTEEKRITEYKDHLTLALPLDFDIEFVDNELLELSINNERIDYTRYIEEMSEDKLVILTQIHNVVVMFGSRYLGRPAQINDLLRVDYLQLKQTTVTDPAQSYTLANLQIDQRYECSGVTLLRREQPADDLHKISRIIPGYFSSKRRMVTPSDHEAIVTSYAGVRDSKFAFGICSVDPLNNHSQSLCDQASGRWSKPSESCCTQVMAYLQYNERQWSNSEEDLVYAYLENHQIAGENIMFRKGEPVLVNLTATIILKPTAKPDDVRANIEKVVEKQCYLLGATFNIAKLTADITNIPGVLHCYINRPMKDRKLAFYGYFKPGTYDIRFSRSLDTLQDFKDKSGGYTPDIT